MFSWGFSQDGRAIIQPGWTDAITHERTHGRTDGRAIIQLGTDGLAGRTDWQSYLATKHGRQLGPHLFCSRGAASPTRDLAWLQATRATC